MKWIVSLLLMSFCSASAYANVSIQDDSLGILSRCFTDAMNNGEVKKTGNSVAFWCAGQEAKDLFDRLSIYTESIQETGQFGDKRLRRNLPESDGSVCWHTIEQSGTATSLFNCVLYFRAGTLITF